MFAERLWDELAPRPRRAWDVLRITFAALLVAGVMLTFRMPFLSIGPYLVFILLQRDTLLTRAASVLAVLVAALGCVLVYLVAIAAWDVAWLRVSLLALIFFGGFYLMRTLAEPRIVLGALVLLALYTYNFDTVPDPNFLLDQLGWVWGIFGLLFVVTFLTQWLFNAPTALEYLRALMRRIFAAAEAHALNAAFGRSSRPLLDEERADAALRIKALAGLRILRPAQAARCMRLLQGCGALLDAPPGGIEDPEEKRRLLAAAAWLRKLRFRVMLGGDAPLDRLDGLPRTPALRAAFEQLQQAADALAGEVTVTEKSRRSLVPADFSTNPAYASFATRATLATMGCYVFLTLTDWNGIHTCLITCIVTALAVAEAREHKQHLRIAGAALGGLLGMGSVIFLIPRWDSLLALLVILAAGTALAAWVALGGKRTAYAGWQIALAFYITVLQDPHPTTDLDAIWDRWVGIVVGIAAMRIAFALPSLEQLFFSTKAPASQS